MLFIITQLIYLSTYMGIAVYDLSVESILRDLCNRDQLTFTLLPCFYCKKRLLI